MGRRLPFVPLRDTASLSFKHVVFGGGVFDVDGEHQNQKGWDIFELGQRSFWAVPEAMDWNAEIVEAAEYREAIAAMLGFLCPGEKTAVTGASLISTMVRSEEAKFYFVEQALEEAKHFDVLRRLIPKITGRPMDPPSPSLRLLYSYGVIDPSDVAFMIGSINVIGEHLANQIFHKINHVSIDPNVKQVIALIGKDESRHVAAGKRFFPEVYPEYKRRRHEIMAKHVATTILLALAGAEHVNPMKTLGIDLVEVMDKMYDNYEDVTGSVPPFPDQAMFDAIFGYVRRRTPRSIRAIGAITDESGQFDMRRFVSKCYDTLSSPRALRDLFAA